MRLNAYRAGSGEPLVLIHGLGGTWHAWEQVIPALTKRYEVFAPDLPGAGDSPNLPDGVEPSVPNIVDAVEEELERSLSGTPHLVGNSWGGEIALELAARGRARSVVAFSPSGLSNDIERSYILNSLHFAHRCARLFAPHAPLLSYSVPFCCMFFAQTRSRPWRVSAEETAKELETMARPVYRQSLELLEKRDRFTGGERIRCPVLISFGTLDFLLGAHQAPRWAKAIPTARIEKLPGCGHIPMSDNPDLVARTIINFLSEFSRS